MIRKGKDIISGACFLLAGLFLGFLSFRLRVWGPIGPVEGFFPLLIAGIIVIASLFVISKSLVVAPSISKEEAPEETERGPGSSLKIVWYSLLLLFYSVLLEPIGFLVTTPIFLILTLKYVEKQNWKKTVWIGLASIVSSYLLFSRFLDVPLPKGLLPWF